MRFIHSGFHMPKLPLSPRAPASPLFSHYRMRSEFTVEQRDGPLHFVMFDKSPAEETAAEAGQEAAAALEQEQGEGKELEQEEGEGEPERAAEQQAEAQADASTSAAAAAEAPAAAAVAAADGKKGKGKKGKGKKGGKPKGPRRVRVDTFPVATKQVSCGGEGGGSAVCANGTPG